RPQLLVEGLKLPEVVTCGPVKDSGIEKVALRAEQLRIDVLQLPKAICLADTRVSASKLSVLPVPNRSSSLKLPKSTSLVAWPMEVKPTAAADTIVVVSTTSITTITLPRVEPFSRWISTELMLRNQDSRSLASSSSSSFRRSPGERCT